MAELLFHGAAGEVTGSMHLLKVNGRWVALDCGLFQGAREESEAKNRAWAVPPREISAVVVSHAHTDHTGRLPMLVRDGFEGPIYATPATRDLCAVMLPDSAHIQEEDAYYMNKRRAKRGEPPIKPLYTYADALATIEQIRSIGFKPWFEPVPGMNVRYREAGHMLGSAGIEVVFGKPDSGAPTLYFTGDVGRRDTPILRDPAPFPQVDTILCESTYGGRVNEQPEDAEARAREAMRRTFDRGGKVIVPAFAVGRAQTVVYMIHKEIIARRLPKIPVIVDSPLAVNATEVFKMHPDCYDAEARSFHAVTGDILGQNLVTLIRNVEESKKLHDRRGPCVIISASGMCEAGRIRHHLKNNIEDSRNLILFPGFQAVNTLGRKLVDGAKTISLFGDELRVRAEIVQVNGFSGHADQADLLRMMKPLASRPPRVYLVHGEQEQSAALQSRLRETGFAATQVAVRGQTVTLA